MVNSILFWNISFKVCNNACIMLRFREKSFLSIFISFLSMMLLILKITLFVRFWWLSNQKYPFKDCNTDFNIPGFDKDFIFYNFYLVWVRINYSVNIEN